MPPKKKRTRTAREEEEIARAQAFYAKLEADKKAKAAGVPTTSSAATAAPKSVKKRVKAKVTKASSKVTTKKPAPSAAAKKEESESDDEPPTPEKQPAKKRRKTSSALANQILEHSKGDESDGESKKPAKRTPQPPPAAYAGRADDATMEIADASPPVAPPQQQPVQPTKRTPQPPPASYTGTVTAANVAAPAAAAAAAAAARPRRARKPAVNQPVARESGNSTPPPRSMMKKKAPFGSPPPRRPSLMDPPDRSSARQKPAPMMPRVAQEPLRKEEEPAVAAPVVPPVYEPKEGEDDLAGIIPEEEPVDETETTFVWSASTKIALVSVIVALLACIAVSISPAPAAFISELVDDSGVCFEDAGWTLGTTPADSDSEDPSPHCDGVQARSPCPGICSNGKLVSCGKYAKIKRDKCVLTPESLKIALALNDLVRLSSASCAFQPTCHHAFFSEFDDDADRPLFYFDKLVGRLGLENIDVDLLKDANQYHNPMFLIQAREDGQVSVGVHPSLPLPQSLGTTVKRWVISSTKWTFFWILGIIRFLLRKLGRAWLACFRSSPWLTALATFIGWIFAVRWYSMRVNASLEAKVVHYRLRALNEIYESEGRETTSAAVFARIAWDEFPTRERDRNHFADTIWVHVERDVAKDPRVRKEVSRENGKTITHWVWTDSRAPNAEE